MSATSLRYALWLCHGVLLTAVTAGIATAELDAVARVVLAAAAAAPLLLAVRGLREGRRYTWQWLAIVLVIYVGVAATEVVATLGASPAASVALLAALAELAVLLKLLGSPSRPPRAPPPRAPRE